MNDTDNNAYCISLRSYIPLIIKEHTSSLPYEDISHHWDSFPIRKQKWVHKRVDIRKMYKIYIVSATGMFRFGLGIYYMFFTRFFCSLFNRLSVYLQTTLYSDILGAYIYTWRRTHTNKYTHTHTHTHIDTHRQTRTQKKLLDHIYIHILMINKSTLF